MPDTAQPLVLVHGFPLDSSMWERQGSFFRYRYPAFFPDLPGFGGNPLKAPSTIEGFAEHLLGFMHANNLEKAVLLGFSMGGYVALAFSELFPEACSGLILADTRAAGDGDEGRRGRDAALKALEAEGIGYFSRNMPQKLLSGEGAGDAALAAKVSGIISGQKPASVRNALLAMRDRKDRTDILRSLPVPALFVCGEKDALTPPEGMEEMARLAPKGVFRKIPAAGHLSNMENPGDFNEAVASFLEGME